MRSSAFVAVVRRALVPISAAVRALVVGLAMTVDALVPAPALASDPWLFVNDVHLQLTSRHRGPITRGGDTNMALLNSALSEMRRLSPNPPVIVMAGDFLAHHLQAGEAVPTMQVIARRFGQAFPHAQFLIALGNEDSACGDYALTPNAPFLAATAKTWAPLVNRNGAAPDFARTFAQDGFYTAKLPLDGVRAVVVDDAFWSPLYHGGCGVRADPTPQSFDELQRALVPVGNERFWLMMHIPPGVDAASTVRLAHHLAIVPLLRPQARDEILAIIGDPARHVELVVTGHIHRFAFRLVERKNAAPIPLLVSPAVSPILGNAPSFLTADVAPDGIVRNFEEHSYLGGLWRDIGGLNALGASEFTAPALVNLQRRLERDADLRSTYATLYMGGSSYSDITPRVWRTYWCATTGLTSSAFRACLDEGGLGFLTRRGVVVVVVAAVAVVLAIVGATAFAIMRLRRRAARAN